MIILFSNCISPKQCIQRISKSVAIFAKQKYAPLLQTADAYRLQNKKMKHIPNLLILLFLLFAASINPAVAEEAVIIHFPLSNKHMGTKQELEEIFKLEKQLEKAITQNNVGEFDGNEIGQGECVLYMYGPDAKKLYKAISEVLEKSQLVKGGVARIRFGLPGSKEEKVKL